MELELKHINPYLPHELKVIIGDNERDLTAVSLDSPFLFVTYYKGAREKEMVHINQIKPILRPLSQLTEEIEHDGKRFVPMEKMQQIYKSRPIHFDGLMFFVRAEKSCVRRFEEYPPLNISQYDLFQKLFEWHFDVFGLIEQGLAIAK